MLLMTVLTTSVSAVYNRFKTVYNLNSYTSCDGTYCYLGSYSNEGYFVAKTGYTSCCKYTSCGSFLYHDSYQTFTSIDSARTGYSNNSTSIHTGTDHPLNLTNADKTSFYGEIYAGSTNQTGRIERIWITRYITPEMGENDSQNNASSSVFPDDLWLDDYGF